MLTHRPGADEAPTELFLSVSKDPWVLLMIVNVLLLLVGMIMESIAAILILAPIITPALMAAGVDPAHLGVVVVLNLMIGLLTPPVGMSLYMVSNVARMPLERVIVGALALHHLPAAVAARGHAAAGRLHLAAQPDHELRMTDRVD